MRPSGHRIIGALALLMVVLLGSSILLPLTVRAQTHEITGFVRADCPSGPGFVDSATVTLTDVNGVNPPRTTTTNLGGVFHFSQPPSGMYSVSANRSGFFNSAPSSPLRFDGTQTLSNVDLCMEPHGTPSRVLRVTVTGAGGSPVTGATVSAFSTLTGRLEQVASGTTSSTGVVNLTLWFAVFRVRATAATLQTNETSVNVAATNTTTISLVAPVELFGHVRNATSGSFLDVGVVAWLYDPSASPTSEFRLIPATVKASLFEFENVRVQNAAYTLIVDAKGYLASVTSITMTGAPQERNINLVAAPFERSLTTVLYGAQDWNNVTIWRNLTLNSDSSLPGLFPPDLRNLRLQIDATPGIGNGDGTLTAAERSAFNSTLAARGPAYVTTDGFITTNGKAYNSSAANFTFTVHGLEVPGSRVWINGSTTYRLKQAPPFIAYGATTYSVNMTMVPDSNVTTRFDNIYVVALPRRYERNGTPTLIPSNAPVEVRNASRVTIDPGVTSGQPQIRLTITHSANGTARAKVVAPAGKFHEVDRRFTSYLAFVARSESITYSAEDSFDPNGRAEEWNYTWRFLTTPVAIRYGIRTNYTFTQNGSFTVNLTALEEDSGNVSFRDITIVVDDRPPTANIRTNRTGTGIANGLELRVDEDVPVRFDGVLSTDLAFPGRTGFILDSGYSWDFDGDGISDNIGRVQNHSFAAPGRFTINLTVTDSVGLKSINATMTAVVNDTTDPVPSFEILDPSNDWTVITSPIEQRTIALNASRSTDNHNNVSELTFTWTIPGPLVGDPRLNRTLTGVNVSFAWSEWNTSYSVLLSVRDQGFGSGRPNTGNLTRNTTVQIDRLLHADLHFVTNSLRVSPADPEEGQEVTVTVNYTNKLDRKIAGNVTAELKVTSGGQTTILPILRLTWFTGDQEKPTRTINPGETVRFVFVTRFTGQGNKTLTVNVFDGTEPPTWRNDNQPIAQVNVRQPWWQPYAIAGAVIGVIALFVGGMYARRKIKAGEWRPIRGRRRERAEGEEKPRREVKEEKKRL